MIVVQKLLTCYAIAMLTKYEHCQCSMAVQIINGAKFFMKPYTVAVSSWSIANNLVIDFYCRCLEILCQIA